MSPVKAGLVGGTLPVLWGASEVILGGDIITEVDGRKIRTREDALDVVRHLEIGQTVTIRYIRGGEERTATAEIEERPVTAPLGR